MWLEQKYLGLISNRLERFRPTRNNHYNFRCPVCGDSRKNKHKARGWVFPKDKGGLLYHCHNCSITLDIDKLIKAVDPVIYDEYVREKLREGYTERVKSDVEIFADKMKPPSFIKDTCLKKLKKISQLHHTHPAKVYVQNRKIPPRYQTKLFYAPRFREWVRSIDPNLMQDSDYDEPRLIIPFLDEDKNLFGFQGRSFRKDGIRYLTIMLDKTKSKIYNLEECNRSKTHFILEGPIDAMFVNNSIAMAGGSIDWNMVNENSVFVYDNEPRSKETCEKIMKIIDKGHKVVIFPEKIRSKDINEMIINNECDNIQSMLENNISSQLEAKIIFTGWKKI